MKNTALLLIAGYQTVNRIFVLIVALCYDASVEIDYMLPSARVVKVTLEELGSLRNVSCSICNCELKYEMI